VYWGLEKSIFVENNVLPSSLEWVNPVSIFELLAMVSFGEGLSMPCACMLML
jgi:hypothetical protein